MNDGSETLSGFPMIPAKEDLLAPGERSSWARSTLPDGPAHGLAGHHFGDCRLDFFELL